jgi:DNA-binding GntR family transcriptional regulator
MSTSAESIRHELARRIVTRQIEPGTLLDETMLAAEFSVSRTPVREALRKLASLGLVDQKAHRKAAVKKPDENELAGMFAVMQHLEMLCAGLSAVMMTAAERAELERKHAQMGALVRAGDCEGYTLANETFHSAIYEGTRNSYLAEITTVTRLRLQAFRRAQFTAAGRLADSHAEHGMIIEAILRGERSAAENAMRAHIGHVENAWHHLARALYERSATNARHDL